ncbi:cbb3-type cytochrome c oxidase subunit I [Myxococcota bacterium]|nr:cbb3-type cytochrome c oxidase subunit I [Myxococcota bacterium]MBU1429102.1 cbb3-type cytochrome c oxidase subunit I [Myxococcota bacterium]MBU1899750.1 cbb3-type cytochrome c oxidase subunit I [Myxococcota bacterium]
MQPKSSAYLPADLAGWRRATDHKIVGLAYIFLAFAGLLFSGIFDVFVQAEQMTASVKIVGGGTFHYLFSYRWITYAFLFLLPGLFAGFGHFLVPLQIGAKGLAFPRLSRAALKVYGGGAFFLLLGFFFAWRDTQWLFFVPQGFGANLGAALLGVGMALVALSMAFNAVNFIVTVNTARAEGLEWGDLPLFTWSIYINAFAQLLAGPVLIAVAVALGLDAAGLKLFSPRHGGDPLLLQQLFWFYAQPALFGLLVPVIGVLGEVISALAKKGIFARKPIVGAMALYTLISFFAGGQHLAGRGVSTYATVLFGALGILLVVILAVMIFNLVLTLNKGAIGLMSPMLFALGALVMLGLGLASGMILASPVGGAALNGTTFEAAYFEAALIGGGMMGFFAAAHFWWSKLFGRTYKEGKGQLHAVALTLLLAASVILKLIVGLKGLGQHPFAYEAGFGLMLPAGIAAVLAQLILLCVSFNLLVSVFTGAVMNDPWRGKTLEWQTPSPPPPANFDEAPEIVAPYQYPAKGGA